MTSSESENRSTAIKQIIEDIAKNNNLKEYDILLKNIPFTGDNFCGEISKAEIRSQDKNNPKSINLFLKSALSDLESRTALPPQLTFKTEIFLYSKVIPALDRIQNKYKIPQEDRVRIPKFYKGVIEEYKELIVMEDVSSEGFILRDKRLPLDLDHVTLVLKKLARLHAASFALKKHDPELFSKFYINQGYIFKEFGLPFFQSISPTVFKALNLMKYKSKIDTFAENASKIMDCTLDTSLTEPYNVICHGDAWNNNILFNYKNGTVDNLVLLDWQISRTASPSSDLAYLFCMSTDIDLLNNHMDGMLNTYYEALRQAASKMDCDVTKMFSMEVLKEHLKFYMPFGLMMAIIGNTLSLSDPEEAKNLATLVGSSQDTIIVSELARQRITGLMEYFVTNEVI